MAKFSQINEAPFLNVGRITLPIYYEDTDFTGYVFHANFLKYFDRAREQALGLKFIKELYEAGKHFVVKKAEINYFRPVRHGDTLVIESQVKYSDSPLVIFRHEAYVMSNLDTQNNPTVVEGLIQLVSVDHRGRPQRLPREIQEHFNSETATAAGVRDGKHNKP